VTGYDQFTFFGNSIGVFFQKSGFDRFRQRLGPVDRPFQNNLGIYFVDVLPSRSRRARVAELELRQPDCDFLIYVQHGHVRIFLRSGCDNGQTTASDQFSQFNWVGGSLRLNWIANQIYVARFSTKRIENLFNPVG